MKNNDQISLDRDTFLETAIEKAQLAIVAVDILKEDQPISYANDAFLALSGYTRDEVLGRNCRFLQGKNTSPAIVQAIRHAIDNGEEGYFELLNYKKDGTPFWNGLHIGPVHDADGKPFIFFGSQRDITIEVEARQRESMRAQELRHRLSNLMSIVGVIVRNTPLDKDVQSLKTILESRIAALGVSTDLLFPKLEHNGGEAQSLQPQHVELRTILETILRPFGVEDRAILDGPAAALFNKEVTSVALGINELATNSAKYGALSVPNGKLQINWRIDGDRCAIDWIEKDGPPVTAPERKGMGTALLQGLLHTSKRPDAEIEYGSSGLEFRFDTALEID